MVYKIYTAVKSVYHLINSNSNNIDCSSNMGVFKVYQLQNSHSYKVTLLSLSSVISAYWLHHNINTQLQVIHFFAGQFRA